MLPIAISEPRESADRRHFLQTLERGMAVIELFSRERPGLTLSDVSQLTGVTRATARRVLLTLQELGYLRSEARTEGRLFSPTPRLLRLGWAYLASLNLTELALPFMQDLVDRTQETSSIGALDQPEIIYIARVPTRRAMWIGPQIGARLPAHNTSLGQVLLAGMPADELKDYLDTASSTGDDALRFDPDTVEETLDRVRSNGWALVDREFEAGFRSIAAPIVRSDGRTVAAMNLSSTGSGASVSELRKKMVPLLVETAAEISSALARQSPAAVPSLR